MAKKRKSATTEAMPYVIAFVVCENVLIETDNVASAIRIVDTVTLPAGHALEVGQSIVLPALSLLLILKAGDARGKRTFTLRLVTPESPPVTHPAVTWTFTFTDPPESGQNNRLAPVSVVWAGDGLYYFEVAAGDSVLARTPLLLKTAPAAPQTAEKGPR